MTPARGGGHAELSRDETPADNGDRLKSGGADVSRLEKLTMAGI